MTLAVLFFARQIIDLVAGTDGFVGAENVLKILIIAAAITYMGQLLGYTVVALNVQRKMMWGYVLGAVLGTALYFTLIPKFSYIGAASATVAVEAVVFIYAYVLTSTHTKFFPAFTIAGKAFLAAMPMAIFYYFINLQFLLPGTPEVVGRTASWIVEALIGLSIYIILLFVFKAIPKNFLRLLLSKEAPAGIVK
jgi:O-antigen/teichoic acid export membrane protein